MKKKKYDNGGLLKELLPSILGLIPGGNIVNTGLSLFNQLDNQPQAYKPAPVLSSNPFGRELGGPIDPLLGFTPQKPVTQGPRPYKLNNSGTKYTPTVTDNIPRQYGKAERGELQKELEVSGTNRERRAGQNILIPEWVRQRLDNNLDPVGHEGNQVKRLNDAVFKNIKSEPRVDFSKLDKNNITDEVDRGYKNRLDAWSLYLGQPQKGKTFKISEYLPSKGDSNQTYYDFDNLSDQDKQNIINDHNSRTGKVTVDKAMVVMGNYTTEKGKDTSGDYISYYDKWDLDNDEIVGSPFEIYGRIYYDPKTGKPVQNKKELGGPILPIAQESTYVQPRPFLPQLPIVQPIDPNLQVQQMRASNQYNPITGLGKFDANGGTGKVHSKDRFREKSNGGLINDDFKQYDSGSHKSGNDTEIDQFGNPVSNGVAAIQNKENMYKGFILSDTLTNPETGNKFNVDAMKINKKYPNARLSDIDKNSLDFEMNKLQVLNQEKIDKKESKMAKGGYIKPPQIPYGDPNDAYNRSNELLQLPNTPVIPDGNPVEAYNQAGSLISPLYTNLNPLPTPLQSRSAADLNLPVFNSTTNTTNQVTGTGSNTTERSGLGTLDAIGLGLKGAALLGSVSDAFSSPEIEQPILPLYDRSNQYLQQANVDFSQSRQDVQGISNQQSNAIRSMSGNSAGNYLSRQSGRLAQLQDVMANIGMQENNQRSQLNLNKANIEQGRAIDTANRLAQNRINNQQNQSTANLFDRSLMNDLSNIGSQFREESVAQQAITDNKNLANFTNSQILFALNNRYPNFKFSDDVITKFKNGEINLDQLVNYKS